MWVVIGFGAAVLVGIAAALLIAGKGTVSEEPTPWNVSDLARLQASLMGTLGSVSITGIVLMVALLSNRIADPASMEMNTVAVMFAIAFGYFVQTAFTLSYLPDRAAVGERLFRFYYGLASTLQFRTVMLLALALMSFVEFYRLDLAMTVLTYFIPISTIGSLFVVSVVADSLGLMRLRECLVAALVGVALGALLYAGMLWVGMDDPYAQTVMALIFAGVNGLSYLAAGLVPLTPRRPSLHGFLTRNARRLSVIDMQTTIISLIFLWLAIARLV
jgi:hypothetical protein